MEMSTIIIIRRNRTTATTSGGISGPIDGSMIVDGTVQAVDLAPLSVTNDKIGSVAASKVTGQLTSATINGTQLVDNSVNAGLKLQVGSVTLATLSADVLNQMAIPDHSVTAAKLASPLGGNLHMGDNGIEFTLNHRQYLTFPSAGIGTQTNTQYFRSSSGFAWYRNGSHSDSQLDPGPGGTLLLRLDADGSLIAKGDVLTYSDERLKTNVRPIDGALERLKRLRGCTFDMNGVRAAGVLAQDVLQALPEAVKPREGGLAVSYHQLIGLLIEAIKEVSEQRAGNAAAGRTR